MQRRRLLATGASALAAALAGCTSGDGSNGDGGTTTEPTTTTTRAADTTTQSGGDAPVVGVGSASQYSFSPEQVTVAAGTTVRWEWGSSGHNVVVGSQPADADWSGTEGDASTTYGSGHTYEFTFEVPGTYEYHCAPHRSLGMRGSVIVE